MSGDTCHTQLGKGTKISPALSSVASAAQKAHCYPFCQTTLQVTHLICSLLCSLGLLQHYWFPRAFLLLNFYGLDREGSILQFIPHTFMKCCRLPLKSCLLGSPPKAAAVQWSGADHTHSHTGRQGETQTHVYVLPTQPTCHTDRFLQRRIWGWREGSHGSKRQCAASTQLPINRPSAIGDQSLPFCKALSVTGIELKPRT